MIILSFFFLDFYFLALLCQKPGWGKMRRKEEKETSGYRLVKGKIRVVLSTMRGRNRKRKKNSVRDKGKGMKA